MVPGFLQTGLDCIERVKGAIDCETRNSAGLEKVSRVPRSVDYGDFGIEGVFRVQLGTWSRGRTPRALDFDLVTPPSVLEELWERPDSQYHESQTSIPFSQFESGRC